MNNIPASIQQKAVVIGERMKKLAEALAGVEDWNERTGFVLLVYDKDERAITMATSVEDPATIHSVIAQAHQMMHEGEEEMIPMGSSKTPLVH